MPFVPSLRHSCISAACAVLGVALQVTASAQPAPPPSSAPAAPPLSFTQAAVQLESQSDQWAAARYAVQGAQFKREAMEHIDRPVVGLTAGLLHYNLNLDIDTTNLQPLMPLLAPQAVAAGLKLPNPYHVHKRHTGLKGSLSAIWAIDVHGKNDATRRLLDAQVREAEAEADNTAATTTRTLVERYFGAQLAAKAAQLRATALRNVERHDHTAQRMLDEGLIAKVDRLQARTALEEARQAAQQARDQADLAFTALARTLKQQAPVQPSSPLFVSSLPLPSVDYFIAQALEHHPGLQKVDAKRMQAQESLKMQQAARKPQVYAFGTRGIEKGNDANWAAGVGVRFTLFEGVNRDALDASVQAQIDQAGRMAEQARNDIALLVEKNWMAVEHARSRFQAFAPRVELAQEMVRLREAGLREGTSTTTDLIDAQTQWAKVETERAQAANDYVQALAELLQSCGLSHEFGQYMARADIQIP